MSAEIDGTEYHTSQKPAVATALRDLPSFTVFRKGDLFIYAPPGKDEGIYRVEGVAGAVLRPSGELRLKYDIVRVERRADGVGFAPAAGMETRRVAGSEISSSIGELVVERSRVRPDELVSTIEQNLPEEYGYLGGGQAWPNSPYACDYAGEEIRAALDGIAAYAKRLARQLPAAATPAQPETTNILPFAIPGYVSPERAEQAPMVPPAALPLPAELRPPA